MIMTFEGHVFHFTYLTQKEWYEMIDWVKKNTTSWRYEIHDSNPVTTGNITFSDYTEAMAFKLTWI